MAVGSGGSPLEQKIEAMRGKWGWFVGAGIALVVFGIVALGNLLAATLATVFVTGIMLIVAGAVQIAHSFGAKSWGKVLYWLASGLLYAAAGVVALADPLLASAVMTLMLAAFIFAVGAMRVVAGVDARPAAGWGWVVAGGVLTALFGLFIGLQEPGAATWLIGLLLGIDLLSQGIAWIAFGFGIRPRR